MIDVVVVKKDGVWGRQMEFKDVVSFSLDNDTFSFNAASSGWNQVHHFDLKKWLVSFDAQHKVAKVISR